MRKRVRSHIHPMGWALTVWIVMGCAPSPPPVWVPGWQETSSLAVARTGSKAVIVRDHIYVMGGGQGIPGPETIHRSVESARIHPDGSLGPWQMSRSLNTPRMFLAAAESQGVIYALGGEYFPGGQMKLLNSVERAPVGPDGRLGAWVESSSMLTPRRSPTAAIVDGYLYAIGGYNGIFLQTVERSRILKGGGLGPWEPVPQPLTTARYIHGGAAIGDRIYAFGGHLQQSGRGSSAAEWATVGPEGQLSPWRATSSLLQPRFLAGSAATTEYVFIVGGYDGQYLASVEKARIQPDGNLGPWSQTASLSTPREGAAVVVHQNAIYVIGGSSHGVYLRTVERAEIAEDGRVGYWSSPPKENSPNPLPKPTGFFSRGPFLVKEVLDGDTIVLSNGETVRLIGVDAPEIHHPQIPEERFGKEAKAFLRGLAEGNPCTLEYEPENRRDPYGRLLAYVYVEDRLLNAELIRRGYAYAYTHFSYRRQAEFLALEREAQAARSGLWSASPSPPASQKVRVISWPEADRYYGKYVTVEGAVVATHNSGKACFLNFHRDYRRFLTAVIFANTFPRFPPQPEKYYLGKKVRVSGLIKKYQGKPEILVETPDQIEVLK